MPRWYEGPLAGFDLETTGPDPHTARIVQAAVRNFRGDGQTGNILARDWMVAVEEDIPAAAQAVHGITTERARAEGRPLVAVLPEIVDALRAAWERGGPVVAYNASFDLTILCLECERAGLPRPELGPVVDPMVLDRHVDRYRRGSRKLVDVAAHYRIAVEKAHDAGADALTAMRVAWQIGKRFSEVGALALPDLHRLQVGWAREQREDLQAYLRRTKDPAAVVDPGWPLTEAYTSGRR